MKYQWIDEYCLSKIGSEKIGMSYELVFNALSKKVKEEISGKYEEC